MAEVCTHIGIMERGRLIRFGSVGEVIGAAGRDRCFYRVMLAYRLGDLATRMAGLPELNNVQIDGDLITLEYLSDRAAAARLLARLLAAGLPVAEFRPMEPDLEQAYLRSGVGQVD